MIGIEGGVVAFAPYAQDIGALSALSML